MIYVMLMRRRCSVSTGEQPQCCPPARWNLKYTPCPIRKGVKLGKFMGSVQQLATCDRCGTTAGVPAHPAAWQEPLSLVAVTVSCPHCPGELRVPPGLYQSTGERLVLVRPHRVGDFRASAANAEEIVSCCDRCNAVRGVPATPITLL